MSDDREKMNDWLSPGGMPTEREVVNWVREGAGLPLLPPGAPYLDEYREYADEEWKEIAGKLRFKIETRGVCGSYSPWARLKAWIRRIFA